MNRHEQVERLRAESVWDVLVVGGGAMGLGIASEATRRGYRTALVEQHDFAGGTSSRSTKLIHGGVRYLEQADFGLVREALHERKALCETMPDCVRPISFVIPCRSRSEQLYYRFGLWCYDRLAGRNNLQPSTNLTPQAVRRLLPTLNPDTLAGAVSYQDAQFDDARLAIQLAGEVWRHGGVAVNYVRVAELLGQESVSGAMVSDCQSGHQFAVHAKVVVNATGVMADHLRRLENAQCRARLRFSQGTHLVVDQRFLPGSRALLVPKTPDGRIIFVIPWHGKVLIGTTDIECDQPSLSPVPTSDEIGYLLELAARYLNPAPREQDILSTFAGHRALVLRNDHAQSHQLSRSHVIDVSAGGLISVLGGKWTTFRAVARQVVDRACGSRIQPSGVPVSRPDRARPAGSVTDPDDQKSLGSELPYTWGDVRRAVHEEMACELEDVLARRTRVLFLDATAAADLAESVARFMQREMHYTATWRDEQVAGFRKVAAAYLPHQAR